MVYSYGFQSGVVKIEKSQTELGDQAETLRYTVDQRNSQNENNIDYENVDRELDILNLPPRKEVHGGKKGKTRVKISQPFLRFMFVIIILLIVLTCVFYLWDLDLNR